MDVTSLMLAQWMADKRWPAGVPYRRWPMSDGRRVHFEDPVAHGLDDAGFVAYSAGRFDFRNMAKEIIYGDVGDIDDEGRRRLRPSEVREAQARPKPTLDNVLKALARSDHGAAESLRSLEDSRIDLVQAYQEGLPPVEPLPGSAGMLVRGRRHAAAAPAKEGKSLGYLVMIVDMALAGVRVLVIDRENGADIYARRLEDIVKARGLTPRDEQTLHEHLWYYEFPVINTGTGGALTLMADLALADLIVFDSQHMMLADLRLSEKDPDDYSEFMKLVIDPVFRRGTATLVLDNTGHEEKGRPRGASTKLDLHDVVLNLKRTQPFSVNKIGALEVRTTHSRVGIYQTWRLTLGGGTIGRWLKEGQTDASLLADAVKPILEGRGRPMAVNRLIEALRDEGYRGQQKKLRDELRALAGESGCPLRAVKGGYVWG
jgi:AAA domain